MHYIKLITTLLFLSVCVYANGQKQNYFSYKVAKRDSTFSFPIFGQNADTTTCKNINQFLQLAELELLNGHQTTDIFENVSKDNGTIHGGKTYLSFETLSNNNRYLSIKFDEASCGMTCAYWVKYYNFNSGNGDLMQLKDFFTPEGFQLFNNKVLKKRTAKFKKEVLKAKDADRTLLIEYVLESFKIDGLNDFYLSDTSITINGENSLSKNDKFYDFDMTVKFGLSEYQSYLNDYGRAIFGITKVSAKDYRSNELPQLFEGSINGNLPVLIILRRGYENAVDGIYTYLKRGRGINLNGTLDKQELTLTEYTNSFEENGYINATFDGNQINGYWINKNKAKKLPLTATRR